MIATIFTITYDFFSAPKFVQYQILLMTRKWGSDLDNRVPTFVRMFAQRLARKYGLPGTIL